MMDRMGGVWGYGSVGVPVRFWERTCPHVLLSGRDADRRGGPRSHIPIRQGPWI